MRFEAALFVLGLSAVASGQVDPPSRVARLSYINGSVSIQAAGTNQWAAADLNRPLTTGDTMWADQSSRAEFHTDNAAVRLNSSTSLGLTSLSDQATQFKLAGGSTSVSIRKMAADSSMEIDTPNATISLLREGEYRLDVNPDAATTTVTIRHGQAEVTGAGQALTLRAGESAVLSGADSPAVSRQGAPAVDSFDQFCEIRDRNEQRSQSARYLAPGMVGTEDLDANGTWTEVPNYGRVWYPRVTAGWAPYHYGHWAFVAPWGWTWVDDAPWGFAPFHYGRWAYAGAGWCWVPGPVAVRPVYAPALVAFVGGASWGVSIGIGGPHVGWVPLGPGELFTPAYHVSPAYFNRVNVSNTVINKTVNVTNVYNNTYVNKTVNNNTTVVNQRFINQGAPNAVTAMPQNAFASGRPVSKAGVVVPPAQFAAMKDTRVLASSPVAPMRAAPASNVRVAQPPTSFANRPAVAARSVPPAPRPAVAPPVARPTQPQSMAHGFERPPRPPAAAAAASAPHEAARAAERPAVHPAPSVHPPRAEEKQRPHHEAIRKEEKERERER